MQLLQVLAKCAELHWQHFVKVRPVAPRVACCINFCWQIAAKIIVKLAELEAAVSSAPTKLLLAKPGRHGSSTGTDLWSQPTAQSLESRAPPRPEPDGEHWVSLLLKHNIEEHFRFQ